MKYLTKLCCIFICLAATSLCAQNNLDAYKQLNDSLYRTKEAQVQAVFEAWQKKSIAQELAQRNQVAALWGTQALQPIKPTQWINYSSDLLTRSFIDFELGTISVETLLKAQDANSQNTVASEVNVHLKKIFDEYDGLENMFRTKNGLAVSQNNLADFAYELAENALIGKSFLGDGSASRVSVAIGHAMIENHLKQRAQKYTSAIAQAAAEYGIEEALILAVIHTESAFNPMAKSPAKAYGLMQLVPTSGGREAYRYVFAQDHIPLPQELYQENLNIQLGAAYLRSLISHYFGDVKEPESRLYCAIAAYNTGMGNVAKAFVGESKLRQAIPLINQYTPEQLYVFLLKNLPYHETRDYLQKVSRRMKLYREK